MIIPINLEHYSKTEIINSIKCILMKHGIVFDEDINLCISISGLSFYNLSNEVVQVFNIELERNTNRLKIALSYNIDQKGYTKNSVDLFVNNYEYMCSVK